MVFEGCVQAAFLVHVVHSYKPASGLFAWHRFEQIIWILCGPSLNPKAVSVSKSRAKWSKIVTNSDCQLDLWFERNFAANTNTNDSNWQEET